MKIRKFSPYIFLVLAPLCWAGNFVVGGPLGEALPPFGINLIRCAWLSPSSRLSR